MHYHESKGNLSLTKKMVLIMDGHKSHVSLEIVLKAKSYGMDMISFPTCTSHELQPLDVSCFKSFKLSFRAYRDAWRAKNIGKMVEKQELAKWMSLALKKALIEKNICIGFRTVGILPLNKEAMEGKMGASTIFQHSQIRRESWETLEEDEMFSQTSEKANEIEVKGILHEGIPSPPRHFTHYYVSIEDECSYSSMTPLLNLFLSQSCSQFLRLRKIQIPISYRMKSESIIDYSTSQILTSSDHVDKLHQVLYKKANIEEERDRKQRERELTKAKRTEEKVATIAAKRRKIVEQEARKISRQSWTSVVIRAAREKLQNLVRNGCLYENSRPKLGPEALSIVKEYKLIAKARLEAKKNKIHHGIPLPREPFPTLLEHPSFYSLQRGSEVPLLVPYAILPAHKSGF